MVFSAAERQYADASYAAFISRMSNRAAAAAAPNKSLPKPATSTSNPTGTKSAAELATASKQSATNAKPNGAVAVNSDSNGLKRKAGEISRPNKAQESEKASITSKPATASPAEPAKAPKKGSYMELLLRAKSQQIAPAGAIVNKPTVPGEPMKKKWQKKLQKELDAKAIAKVGKSNSPNSSGNEKAGAKVADKGPLAKKGAADAASGPTKKGAPASGDRKSTTPVASAAASSKPKVSTMDTKARTTAAIRERERSPVARRGSREDGPRAGKASVYDRPKPSAGKRYVYREETDSDTDMEATGIDILEEEEISAKRARLEDIEQEKLEKKLAAEKAARKRAIMGKK